MLTAVDLVEVNPMLGTTASAVNATVKLAVDVIAFSVGQTREGAHCAIDELPIPEKTYESSEQYEAWL